MAKQMSDTLSPHIIQSANRLWNHVVRIQEDCSRTITPLLILTDSEIDEFYKTGHPPAMRSYLEHARDFAFIKELLKREYDAIGKKERLFCGDELWRAYEGLRVFHMRLSYIVHESFEKGEFVGWREDDIIRPMLEDLFGKEWMDKVMPLQRIGLQTTIDSLVLQFLNQAWKTMNDAEPRLYDFTGFRQSYNR